MKIHFCLLLLLFLLPACAGHAQQSQTQTQGTDKTMGILEGRITVGPLRPGPVRAGEPEPEPPPELFEKHRVVILAADTKNKVQETKIDSKGRYHVELPAGKYLVTIDPNDIGIRKQPPAQVTVVAGQTATLDLDFDTGMR